MLHNTAPRQTAASQRELQQQAVAELGQLALEGPRADVLFDRAVQDLSRCLGLRFVKLLELAPDRTHLTLRAGTGWHAGLVGHATVPADTGSQAGFTLMQEDTVVVHDFRHERRFDPPKLLSEHGILCGASIIVGPVRDPWGVLGVHESDTGRCAFDTHDVHFVRSVANILWLFLRNERSLREAERERHALRSFADAMPILLAIVDAEGRYEFANRAYHAFGLSPREMIGRHLSEVLDPEAFRRAAPHVSRALAGDVVSFENRLAVPGTGPADMLVTFAPRITTEGRANGFYAAAVDIGDQKRRQREILERTQQYRAIADSIPYGIWTCDAEGRLTYVSDAFLALVGMTFEQAANFGWISRLLPGSAEETRLAWHDCVARRGDWEREHRFVGSDGQHHDILSIARPVFDEQGELLSYVGLNLDISDRKRREETLALLSAELDHRVKNVFSLVITIARQASRDAVSVEAFRDSFEGRVRALAAAHDMIAGSGWSGMSLSALLETELAPYRDAARTGWRLHGPDVTIPVAAVQPLVLAVHELATNAAKYGALRDREGQLAVRWTFGAESGLRIVWDEHGLSGIAPPERRGFGSRVLGQVLEMQLGAEVTLDFRDVGLRAVIAVPGAVLTKPGPREG